MLTDGALGATSLIKQSLQPIANAHDSNTAQALCNGACRFSITQIGTQIKLAVNGLRPHTIYYYAIAALDNVTARPGAASLTVKTQTS
jgi:hypothetical protein